MSHIEICWRALFSTKIKKIFILFLVILIFASNYQNKSSTNDSSFESSNIMKFNNNNEICECRRSELKIKMDQVLLSELNRTTCDLHNTLRRLKGQKVYSVSLYGKNPRYYHLLECKKPFSFSSISRNLLKQF